MISSHDIQEWSVKMLFHLDEVMRRLQEKREGRDPWAEWEILGGEA